MPKPSESERQREAARQQRLLAVAERRFSRTFTAELARGSREMLGAYERTGTYPQLPDEFRRRVEQAYLDLSAVLIQTFGERILEQGKSAGYQIETKNFAEFFQRLALEFIQLEAVRQRITSVTDTTRNIIIRLIEGGQEDGLGIAEIAKMISDRIPVISRARGALIARTETHAAANYGSHNAAKATGLPLRREWISVEDSRTRDFGTGDGVVDEFNHRAADGQVVGLDEPFRILKRDGSFEAIMFPGDPSGSAGNVINCRCAVANFVEDF
jgi:hypothetical protein